MSTPVRVSTPQLQALPPELAVDPGKEPSADMTQFASSFESRLSAAGVRIRPDAEYRLVIALASQSSANGITSDAGKDAKTITWRSRPRKRSAFDSCSPTRLRAMVVGSKGLSAHAALRADAELDTCKPGKAEFDRLAAALADAISRN